MTSHPKLAPLASLVALGLALGTTGCSGSKALTATATAQIVRENGSDAVEVVVTTAPNASVTIRDVGYTQSWSTTSDFTGVARLKIPLPEPTPAPKATPPPPKLGSSYTSPYTPPAPPRSALLGPEIKLSISVDHYEPRKLFKSKYKSAQTSVTVVRPAQIRFDPSTRQLACLVKSCTGTFSLYQEARLDFSDIEPVTTATLGPEQARTVTRQLSLTLDMKPYLEKVPLGDMFKPYPMGNVDLPLELGFADGTKLKTSINVAANQLKPALSAMLGKVAAGPVLFPDEEARAGGASALFDVSHQSILGKAAKVRDIDLVAVTTDKDRPGCATDGSMEADVTVFERRTGKAVGTRHFSAPTCKDDYDDAAAEAWVKSFVKGS